MLGGAKRMALIIPTSASTFGDATKTSGPFQRYILAQFRSDADLEWIRRARSKLVKAELKWSDVKEARPSLKKDRDLWTRIEKGVGQATIVVIDPGAYEPLVRDTLDKVEIEKAGDETKAVVDACTSEVLAGTPIAYLPAELHKAVPWVSHQITSLEKFSPKEIADALGGGLKHAVIFAARAHAIFDVARLDESKSTTDALRSPRLARVILPEILSTARYFDIENPATVKLLNKAVDIIASAITGAFPGLGDIADQPLVIETDSKGYDELQASDVAAGWAREMLELSDAKNLGSQFERVWLNGKRIK